MDRIQEISEGSVVWALLRVSKFQNQSHAFSASWSECSGGKIKHQVIYSQILSSAGQGPSHDKTMLLCCGVFLDQACKILDWQACRLSKQSLSFVLSVWFPVSFHDHYTNTLTQRRRSVNLPGLHQKQMLKSIEGTNVHLELENSSKAKHLSALWIIFPVDFWTRPTWFNPNERILTLDMACSKDQNPWIEWP